MHTISINYKKCVVRRKDSEYRNGVLEDKEGGGETITGDWLQTNQTTTETLEIRIIVGYNSQNTYTSVFFS